MTPRRSASEVVAQARVQIGEGVGGDESLCAGAIARMEPLQHLEVAELEGLSFGAEGGAAAVIDEEIVAQAHLEARRLGALAEVVLLAIAALEALGVEEADALDHLRAEVEAEAVRGDDLRSA